MSLKYKYAARAEIPPEHVAFYVAKDGGFVLDADGVADKTKLEEFRANNVALLREHAAILEKFKGVEPEEFRKLAAAQASHEEALQIKAGDAEKVFEKRLAAFRASAEKNEQELRAERDAMSAQLTAIQIDQAVVAEATKRGMRPTALQDIVARARVNLRLVGGKPEVLEDGGKATRVGPDGSTPMTMAEWVGALVSDAPHLFEANAGGGAAGSGSSGAGNRSGKNPFAQATWNLTEQMKLQKTDPATAERMKRAA